MGRKQRELDISRVFQLATENNLILNGGSFQVKSLNGK